MGDVVTNFCISKESVLIGLCTKESNSCEKFDWLSKDQSKVMNNMYRGCSMYKQND